MYRMCLSEGPREYSGIGSIDWWNRPKEKGSSNQMKNTGHAGSIINADQCQSMPDQFCAIDTNAVQS